MIEDDLPGSWRELQETVARILSECGLTTSVEKSLQLARGTVVVDVFAEDPKSILPSTCVIECKYWKRRVPQTVVHSLRTVCADVGCNNGFVVSSAGFQRGAIEAAMHTNVRLFSYRELEAYFEPIWTDAFFRPKLYEVVDPLIEYTEPINTRIFRKADALKRSQRNKFKLLRRKYLPVSALAMLLTAGQVSRAHWAPKGAIPLPLAGRGDDQNLAELPPNLVEAKSARVFFERFTDVVNKALGEFDETFGERA